MADTEGQRPAASSTATEEGGRLDTLFIKKPSGYIIIINFFLAFLAFCLMSGWVGDTGYRSGHYGFFLYACTHTWVALIIIFVFKLVKVAKYCDCINWDLTYCINALVFVIILLIGSSVIAQRASYWSDVCDYVNCHLLTASSIFGFAAMIGCAAQCFFHYKDFRET